MKILKLLLGAALLIPSAAAAQDRRFDSQDGSGLITTAGTGQIVFTRNTQRIYLMCQNPLAATEPLFVGIGLLAVVGTASVGTSIELAPGGSTSFLSNAVPTGNVSVAAATIGHRFICKQGTP